MIDELKPRGWQAHRGAEIKLSDECLTFHIPKGRGWIGVRAALGVDSTKSVSCAVTSHPSASESPSAGYYIYHTHDGDSGLMTVLFVFCRFLSQGVLLRGHAHLRQKVGEGYSPRRVCLGM